MNLTRSSPALAASAAAAMAAVAIGHALVITDGMYDSRALAWIAAGLGLTCIGVFLPHSTGNPLVIFLCIAGVLWQIWQNMEKPPVLEISDQAVLLCYYTIALPLMGAAAVGAVLLTRLSRPVFIPLLLATHFVMGAALLHFSRPPLLDVYGVSTNACQAISNGISPYAVDFANSAYGPWQKSFFPPGSVVNGRVELGYPYMPLDLAVEYPSYVLTHDFRYGLLLAMTVAGGLVAYCAGGPLPAAAGLLLLTPMGYFTIQQSWVDPVVVVAMAAVVFCACRAPRWTAVALGLLIVSKQDLLLVLPVSPLLLPRAIPARRFFATAISIAAAVTLPLVLWNPRAFWHSAVEWHLRNPFRGDSLNFAAAWVHLGHAPPPDYLAFIVASVAMLAALIVPRSAAGFSMVVSLIYLCFFAAAKLAFCNYYIFVISVLCCAVAASGGEDHSPA